jgi:large subunit ribosomal protein L25
MDEIELNAELRTVTGKAVRHLRSEGLVPAVVYGHFTEPVSVQVDERLMGQVLRQAGTNRLITLSVKGLKDDRRVLVRDLQRDAITHSLLHVDFYEVVMTEKISAEVPVVLVGVSPIVEDGEGILFQGLDSVEIESLPGDLPPSIEIDLTPLAEIDDGVQVGDLDLGEAIRVLSDPEETVVRILPLEAEIVEEVVEVPEAELVGEEGVPVAEAEVAEEAEEEAEADEEAAADQ